MMIVLRNTTSRKDAVYIIEVDEDNQKVAGWWGRWDTYQAHGLAGLRSQMKWDGPSYQNAADKLLRQKLEKGYVPVDQLPASVSTPAAPDPNPPSPRPRSRAAMLEL